MKVELNANNYLKLLRKSHCLTQEELAKKLGISQTYYSQIETGQRRPSISVFCKIHKLFNVSDYIMWQLISANNVRLDESKKEKLNQIKDKILKAKFEDANFENIEFDEFVTFDNDNQRHQ